MPAEDKGIVFEAVIGPQRDDNQSDPDERDVVVDVDDEQD